MIDLVEASMEIWIVSLYKSKEVRKIPHPPLITHFHLPERN
jgi:hypothetical protein